MGKNYAESSGVTPPSFEDQRSLLSWIAENDDLDVEDLLAGMKDRFSDDLINWYTETALSILDN